MNKKIKLKNKYLIIGQIKTLTGLRIGGSETGISIGKNDNPILKHPVTKHPYIPGSSLKGKIRSLIELRDGTIGGPQGGGVMHGPCQDPNTISAKLFGTANGKESQRPSRLIVRDAILSAESINGKIYTEVKTEVVIDRITAKANPRPLERVPSNIYFDFQMILNEFEELVENAEDEENRSEDSGNKSRNEKNYMEDLLNGLLLLQDDYLGGHGSRGSGQVDINISEINRRSPAFYLGDKTAEDKSAIEDYKTKFPDLFNWQANE